VLREKKAHYGMYADLMAYMDAADNALSEQGIAVIQPQHVTDSGNDIQYTILGHSSGQYIMSKTRLPCKNRDDPQQFGASITYLRRFTYAAMVGLAPEDDDGNAASGKKQNQQSQQGNSKPQTQPTTTTISEAQGKRLFAIAKKSGWTNDALKDEIKKQAGVSASKDIKKGAQYNGLIKFFEANVFAPQNFSEVPTTMTSEAPK